VHGHRRWLAAAVLSGSLVGVVLAASLAVVPSWLPGSAHQRWARQEGPRPSEAVLPLAVGGAAARQPGSVSVVTANLWRENPAAEADLAALVALGVDVVGINEGRLFRRLVGRAPGYLAVLPTEVPAGSQNPILLRRETTRFLGSGAERMCESVGSAPERWAVYALFEIGRSRLAYVNTHLNSHVEDDGTPFELPRVGRYVEHVHRLAMLVRSLQDRGYRVLVGGDFNWAWTSERPRWRHAPAVLFEELGLEVNWAHGTAPRGGSFGDRRIDYLAHDGDVLEIDGQQLLRGHSDHVWPLVTYRLRPGAEVGRSG
jgi:endonuclease/exonuclease/phosphatase (EEP) superfamily protein YafD